MKKIEKKIVGYAVKASAGDSAAEQKPELKQEQADDGRAEVIRMHEKLERPEMLIGSTYKVKTPISDHALYVTINDIVLNEGTEYEKTSAVRSLYQFKKSRSLSMDRRADPSYVCGLS